MRQGTVAACIIAALTVSGCSFGSLRVEPSGYRLTPEMMKYADGLERSRETDEFYPIPYAAEGAATHQCADEIDWFLLYTGMEQFGKLDAGYGYEDVGIIWPVWIGVEAYRYDDQGDTIGSRHADAVGVFWPLPMTVIASLAVERTRNHRIAESHADFGLKVLQLPVVQTSLLKISSTGFELLFIPFWTKDRSPRLPPDERPEPGPEPETGAGDPESA